MSGRGIVCFISNYSWLREQSFVVLRQHLLSAFDSFWIENMHGDRKISEYAPDGHTSETIFAIPGFSPGIQQGTAISLWIKSSAKNEMAKIHFRDDLEAARSTDRRAELLESLHDPDAVNHYQLADPCRENRYSFRPSNVAAHYREWPKLAELANEASNGLMEKRRGALIDMDRGQLEHRMRMYYDPQVKWEELVVLRTGLTEEAAGYDPHKARAKLQATEKFQSDYIRRYAVRPFETRWCYYSSVSPLWNRSRPTLWAQCWEGNSFVLSRMKGTASPEGVPFYFVSGLSDDHLLMTDAVCFPIRIRQTAIQHVTEDIDQNPLIADTEAGERIVANLSIPAREYIAALGITDPDTDIESAGLIWMHALAVGFAPVYLEENADGVRESWPCIPLPATAQQLRFSAALGNQLAALLNTEQSFDIAAKPALRKIGTLTSIGNSPIGLEANSLDVRANWGHVGREGITVPGRGKFTERSYSEEELATFIAAGLPNEDVLSIFGASTYDIYLNERVYWKNIPTRVWNYHIGGYQVIKKWLSYHEYIFLGRSLTPEEAREVTNIARRLAAILILEPALNANYRKTVEDVYSWPTEGNAT